MMEILKTALPIFYTPSSYTGLLRKLASFIFYETYIASFFLRDIPAIDSAFDNIENTGQLGAAIGTIPHHDKINIVGLTIAIVVALICYAFKFHDRISDMFGLRRRYDRANILLPLANLVGARLSPMQLNAIDANRDTLMRQVFYRYASSRADSPLVDKHDIEHALGMWSWYWILLEGMALFVMFALIALYFGAFATCSAFAGIIVLYFLTSAFLYPHLERYTRPQVEKIAGNPEAALAVRQAFDAL